MGRFLNPDNRAFQDVVNSRIYVDKTGLLEYTNRVIDTTAKFICNSRPRRFGKSITADMLTAYYSRGCDSKELFASLEIGQSENFEKYLNQYDVFHLDIQWCMMDAKNPEKTVDYINHQMIAELKEAYPDILSDSVQTAYGALSQIYTKTGNRFIVIIDEWDVLIRDEAANQAVQEDYINFLRGMLKGSEPSKFIHFAYLTGILPIKKVKTQSALNNFDEYTMLDAGELASYIGFTEKEVKELSERYGRDFREVKRWYDGYVLEEQHMYNPRAVVSVMLRGKYQSYWSQTGTYESILPLINKNFDGLKTAILTMLSGDEVRIKTTSFQNDMVSFRSRDDVLTLLIHLGYLAYDQKKQTAYIPNEEIRREFADAVEENKWNELIEFENQSRELLEATLDMDADAVAAGIEKIHMEYASSIQYHDENSLSSVLAIAYLSTIQYYFKPIRELPSGRGFADFVFIPKIEYTADYPALVVELKWNKNAETALQQIKDKKYPDSLLQYTGHILIVGINYDKKSKVHQCSIENYEK
ncbi:MAG: AAA family ATPase [Lachnospiraceae bacterium]|nr:AAA family ATPase [Lachnospiraceae bacterium]